MIAFLVEYWIVVALYWAAMFIFLLNFYEKETPWMEREWIVTVFLFFMAPFTPLVVIWHIVKKALS